MLFVVGCDEQQKNTDKSLESDSPAQIDNTIGQLADLVAFSPIPVKGIGIVVGLNNTGSSECPPMVRDYLRQYIIAQLGKRVSVNPDMMINSRDTAIVLVEGSIPPGAAADESFDITVTALPNTQTTSLKGGRLYTTDLKFTTQSQIIAGTSKILAVAAGAVYIDTISQDNPDLRKGLILGGGKVIENHQLTLALFKPNYRLAAIIRNRINERFGRDTTNAVSEGILYLSLPHEFKDRKERFIELIRSLYITSSAVSEERQINELIEKLKNDPAKEKYETGLEAIGKPVIIKLLPLLESSDIMTRFYAAKCLFNIGDLRALKSLREFAQDTTSIVRIDAIKTLASRGKKQDIIALMNRIVRDDDFDVRYAAYEYLQRYNDPSIIRTAVAQDFYIDQIIHISPKAIFVSRKDEPRIVLFGAPIICQEDIFIESDNGHIIINALPDEKRISAMCKHPITGELVGPLKTSFRLTDLIRTLGDDPAPKDEKKRAGLGIPYSQIAELVKKMCDKGAVKADFVPGPLSPQAQ